MKIRCSSLPLVTQCSQAAQAPRVAIELGDPELPALGSGTHAVLSKWIDLGECSEDPTEAEIGEAADAWHVAVKELIPLVRKACRAWRQVSRYFPEPATELPLSYADAELELTGTADLVALVDADEVRIGDFKTGFLDSDFTEQLKGYAFLALQRFPERRRVRVSTLRVRDSKPTLHSQTYTAEELQAWWKWLKGHLLAGVYRPDYGSCGNCKRWLECDAGRSLTRDAAEYLIDVGHRVGADFDGSQKELELLGAEYPLQLSPADLIEIVHRARLVEKAAKLGRDMVKTTVKQLGTAFGDEIILPAGADGSLVISSTKKREIAYDEASVDILNEAIGERFQSVCSISATKTDAEIKAQAPRGMKGRAVENVMAALEAAGSLTFETTERLDIKRTPTALEVLA